MYHEEKVINGRLCWRGSPDGDWVEYSYEHLLDKLQKCELSEFNYRTAYERLQEKELANTAHNKQSKPLSGYKCRVCGCNEIEPE